MPADRHGSRYVGERLDRLPMALREARQASELERLERQLRRELALLAGQEERERQATGSKARARRDDRHLHLVTSELPAFATDDHAA